MYCFKGGFNMRKKLVGTLLIAAMTASTLAGCGSSNSTAGTSASGGAAETSPAESATEAEGTDAADGEEVLTVWCWDPTFNVYAMKQAEAIFFWKELSCIRKMSGSVS